MIINSATRLAFIMIIVNYLSLLFCRVLLCLLLFYFLYPTSLSYCRYRLSSSLLLLLFLHIFPPLPPPSYSFLPLLYVNQQTSS